MENLALFAILVLVSFTIPAFADVTVSAPAGSSVPGCEDTNECFIPSFVSVKPGETVIWSNDDSAAHTVTSGSQADGPDGNFDSSLFMAGTTFAVTFDEAGTYPYFCMVHPWMVGIIQVGSGSSSSSTTSITVSTNRDFYNTGDVIVISGRVGDFIAGTPVSILVISPLGSIVTTAQIDVSSNTQYSTIISNTDSWKNSGTYTVKVQYGSTTRAAETSFFYDLKQQPPSIGTSSGFTSSSPAPTPQSISVNTDRVDYDSNDVIGINGNIQNYDRSFGNTVTITILNPANTMVSIADTTISDNGLYFHSFYADKNTWSMSGTYTVNVKHGKLADDTRFSFKFTSEQIPKSEPIDDKFDSGFSKPFPSSDPVDDEYESEFKKPVPPKEIPPLPSIPEPIQVTVATNGELANQDSFSGEMSKSGRYVVFISAATNLVDNDNNYMRDIFVRDLVLETTTLVSITADGNQADSGSEYPSISNDGQYIVFTTKSALVPEDVNSDFDVYLFNQKNNKITRISEPISAPREGRGNDGVISGDGRYVVFRGGVLGYNFDGDLFIKDLVTQSLIDIDTTVAHTAFSINSNGKFIVFTPTRETLLIDGIGIKNELYVYDRTTKTASLVSVPIDGIHSKRQIYIDEISGDGRFVVFQSSAPNLVENDENYDTASFFISDLVRKTTELISIDHNGKQFFGNSRIAISDNGRFVIFEDREPLILDRRTDKVIKVDVKNIEDISGDGTKILYRDEQQLFVVDNPHLQKQELEITSESDLENVIEASEIKPIFEEPTPELKQEESKPGPIIQKTEKILEPTEKVDIEKIRAERQLNTLLERGDKLFFQEKYDLALSNYEKAVEMFPENLEAQQSKQNVLDVLGESKNTESPQPKQESPNFFESIINFFTNLFN